MSGPAPRPIRIGTRGSQLALWQANFVASALRRLGHEVGIEIIRTAGDRRSAERLRQEPAPQLPPSSGKGIFTKEIEDALLDGAIDVAVHSLKDLPTEIASAFTLAAIPPRAAAADALVAPRYASLEDLPPGAVVGTGSPRRRAQLLHWRPDLQFTEFRGNVDTRLKKLTEGQADAIVLAAAGLDRLGKGEWVRQRFAPEVLCPAPGQGALALECRSDDVKMQSAIQPLEDPATRSAVTAERALLAAMGGGCEAPIGAYCHRAADGALNLRAVVASGLEGALISGRMEGSDPRVLGEALAQELLARFPDVRRAEWLDRTIAPRGSGRR